MTTVEAVSNRSARLILGQSARRSLINLFSLGAIITKKGSDILSIDKNCSLFSLHEPDGKMVGPFLLHARSYL
jgi:hypothetical protein